MKIKEYIDQKINEEIKKKLNESEPIEDLEKAFLQDQKTKEYLKKIDILSTRKFFDGLEDLFYEFAENFEDGYDIGDEDCYLTFVKIKEDIKDKI